MLLAAGGLSDEELHDELLTLLVAGHETTASSLAWGLGALAHHRSALDRLRDELEAGEETYLTATIHEILRSRPVLPNVAPRLVAHPIEIGGQRYPTDVCLVPNAYLVHHDPELYPDPYSFRPERFLDAPPGTYTWIPFGGGRRRCLGASFALLEMRLVLTALVRRYDLRAAGPQPASPAPAEHHDSPGGWLHGATPPAGAGTTRFPGERVRRDTPVMAGERDLAATARRRILSVGWTSALSGTLVTFMAVGFLMPLVGISKHAELRTGLINGAAVAVYLFGCHLLERRIGAGYTARTLSWLPAGRAPSVEEHRRTLSLALHEVKIDALMWAVAAVGCGVFNGLITSWALGAVVAVTIWLGGETTCALGYMLYERALRPVTARALAHDPGGTSAPGVRLRLAMAWLLGTGVPLIGVLALGALAAFGSTRHPQYVGAAVLFLGCVAVATGFAATLLAAKAIADPLHAVRRGLSQIEQGELEVSVPVDDGSEVGQLQAGFNQMAEGLRERQRIRELFGRQVGEDVARAALTDGVRLGGEERHVAALFVDIVGSTSLALALPPTEVVALLNRFFRVVVEVVEASEGLVNKFEGDAALCVFGAPVAREDPAGDALGAARRLAERLSRELPEIDFGIGASAGTAVAGNVGAESRFEYTVIGDPVNEAARLAELAKQRPERVLASAAALEHAAPAEREAWTLTESAQLRGRLAPTRLAHPAPEPAPEPTL